MTNIADKTIDTSHIPDEVVERWIKIESLDWEELINTLPKDVIAAIWDTKVLIEDCFSVTQSSFQDRHGNITDTNGNPITAPQSQKLWFIKATNQEDAQTVKENIRVY